MTGLHAYKLGVTRVTVGGREAKYDVREPVPEEQLADAFAGKTGHTEPSRFPLF